LCGSTSGDRVDVPRVVELREFDRIVERWCAIGAFAVCAVADEASAAKYDESIWLKK